MDSRDIKLEPGEVVNGNYLLSMYNLQKELLEGYIGIEGLPKYPLDVNTKKSQIILKDFTSRIIEELAEGYESLELVHKLVDTKLHYLFNGQFDPSRQMELMNHLQNANEENADAMHFFLELLIYTNIQPDDIMAYAQKWARDHEKMFPKTCGYLSCVSDNQVLEVCLQLGDLWIGKMLELESISTHNKVNTLNLIDEPIREKYNPNLVMGGSLYNEEDYLHNIPQILWAITHHLNISRNFLKNKPWKQSSVMTQELAYQEEVVKAFIFFCGYLYWIDNTAGVVYYQYFKKNHVNRFRQKSNY